MTVLNWHTARREDRGALQSFCCTPPVRRTRRAWGWQDEHSAPYELQVQSLIRDRLAPVGTPGRTVLLGWDKDDELGGVAAYQALGSASFLIGVVAVSLVHRGHGGGVGREMLSTVIDFTTADADQDGYSVARLSAKIHQDNHGSQRLFRQFRFDQTAEEPEGYQVWAADVEVGGTLPLDG